MKLKRNIAGSIGQRFGARRARFIATAALLFVVVVTGLLAVPGGTAGTGMLSLNTNRYWQGTVTSGAFTNTTVRLTDSSVNSTSKIGKSETTPPGGTYNSIGGTVAGSTITSDLVTSFSFFVIGSGCPSSLTVNDTGDGADATPGDGVCETASGNGVCTLRAAIQEANALSSCSGAITINFSISGSGVKTITPASVLPVITRQVIIDGTTQAGSSCTTVGGLTIELDGTNAGATGGQAGLQLNPTASGSTIKGLVINRFGSYGMFVNSSNNNVQCNYVGTNVAGTSGLGNHNSGIRISGNSNVVGGLVAGNGNIFSGNSSEGIRLVGSGNQVQGNYVGIDAAGTAALPNGGGGVDIQASSNTTVGGTSAGARNVISGNTGSNGVLVATSSNTIVQGNYIGTDATGTNALGNKYGVNVNGGATIGGIGAGEGNLIAFNITQGIVVFVSANNSLRGNSIYSNGGPGIDLNGDGVTANDNKDPDSGPNNLQNFPVLTPPLVGATTVIGTLNSTVGQTFIIDVYSNDACDPSGNGEGKTYLGSVTTSATDSNGNVSFNVTVPAVVLGKPLTATATDASGNTSEFSVCVSPMTTTAANGNVSGQIVDSNGNPVEGAAVHMSGTQNRLTVTDAQGHYQFDEVETNGFYSIVPARANFGFSPSQRSFSALGQHTDAVFSAIPTGTALNPMDASEYFVRQQYLDFLGREPDESGFNFWVNNIEKCGADANCRAAKRVDTSAAFFLSSEFQETGYLVYRTYQAAYGDLPSGPVPIKLNEFKPDTAEIGNGVIVNQSGWEQKLDSNKQAYASEFVQRPRFTAAYPVTLTSDQFVDKLFTNAGVTPSASDRAAAVSEFGSATTTADAAARGRALRRIAENSTLARLEFNQAFVLMQYFGYLRRDANTGRDIDFAGYNFWLDKLNTFNGNFRNAEMVKAFLVSAEYRERFPL